MEPLSSCRPLRGGEGKQTGTLELCYTTRDNGIEATHISSCHGKESHKHCPPSPFTFTRVPYTPIPTPMISIHATNTVNGV